MNQESQREDNKKRVVKFVNQTQTGCLKATCLCDLCKKNPGRIRLANQDFKGMKQKDAILLICVDDGSKINSLWICDDDGDIGNFSNELIRAKIDSNDYAFFENDYVRFLARIEGLALGFIKGNPNSYNSEIDFSLIHKVCDVIQDMPTSNKLAMYDNLQAYRVS